ncbi:endosome protein [Favolaschia claudopus]|uniref:Endosome protein n=1 Tax=Favolaschia claudopus TaxID=2862362 RepID=A0AAW0DER7_9AGAR
MGIKCCFETFERWLNTASGSLARNHDVLGLRSHLKSRTTQLNEPPNPPPPLTMLLPLGHRPHRIHYLHDNSDHTNATLDDYEIADHFCRQYPDPFPAKVFPDDFKPFTVDKWGIVQRKEPADDIIPTEIGDLSIFCRQGLAQFSLDGGQATALCWRNAATTSVPRTSKIAGDACLTSNLPLIAGHYISSTKRGVYFEITVRRLEGDATIALGMQCFPGGTGNSAALHFDDCRLYYDDPDGGVDYVRNVYDPATGTSIQRPNIPQIKTNDTIGCGYEFPPSGGIGSLFYTYNGERLTTAFPAIFDPRPAGREVDVYAAVGITSGPCQFDVNFGLESFKWSGSGQQAEWTVDGLFRHFGDGPPEYS